MGKWWPESRSAGAAPSFLQRKWTIHPQAGRKSRGKESREFSRGFFRLPGPTGSCTYPAPTSREVRSWHGTSFPDRREPAATIRNRRFRIPTSPCRKRLSSAAYFSRRGRNPSGGGSGRTENGIVRQG